MMMVFKLLAFCYFWGLIKESNEYQGKFIANINFKMRKELEWTLNLRMTSTEFYFLTTKGEFLTLFFRTVLQTNVIAWRY